MAEKTEQPHQQMSGDITSLTVEELYDKDKFDLSTMEQGDVLALLQYVSFHLFSFYFFIVYLLPLFDPSHKTIDCTKNTKKKKNTRLCFFFKKKNYIEQKKKIIHQIYHKHHISYITPFFFKKKKKRKILPFLSLFFFIFYQKKNYSLRS